MGKINARNVIACIIGVILVGAGTGINNCAGLGNDPVGIFYDGIRAALGLSVDQLGMVSNGVNAFFIVVLLLVGRRYLSIGTIIYLVPYGLAADLGVWLYGLVVTEGSLAVSIVATVIGCACIYVGVATFVIVNIGVDPMTGTVLVVRDALGVEYQYVRMAFDISIAAIGFLLGGTLGVPTIITGLTGGPGVQACSNLLKRHVFHYEEEPAAGQE